MSPLLSYLIKMMAASALLYAYYFFVLRNKRFHQYNRYYLLVAVVLSIFLPLLNIPLNLHDNLAEPSLIKKTFRIISFNDLNLQYTGAASSDQANFSDLFTGRNLLSAIYILGTLLFAFRIIISLRKIAGIAGKYPSENIGFVRFYQTDAEGTPFSFFKWLFWNNKIDLKSEKGEQVFRHELFHIQQRHSWDVLFMEMITMIFWINPVYHLVKKELKTIHEFLADEYAMGKYERWQYAELLLMEAMNTRIRFVNPFFHNQIKRRITMITSSKKTSYQYFRKIMVLPLILLVSILVAFKVSDQNPNKPIIKTSSGKITDLISEFKSTIPENIVQKNEIPNSDTTKPNEEKPLIVVDSVIKDVKDISKLDIEPSTIESINVLKGESAIKKYGKKGENGVIEITTKKYKINGTITIRDKIGNEPQVVFDKVEKDPEYNGGLKEWTKYLEKNIDPSIIVKNGCSSGRFTAVVQFIVDEKGNIISTKPVSKNGYGIEEHLSSVISKGPKWAPAIQNGRAVPAYLTQKVVFIIGNGLPDHSSEEGVAEYPGMLIELFIKAFPENIISNSK